MPTFRIAVREVHISTREIEAETAEEALRLYKEGEDEGDEISCEYSHTLEGDDAITLARSLKKFHEAGMIQPLPR